MRSRYRSNLRKDLKLVSGGVDSQNFGRAQFVALMRVMRDKVAICTRSGSVAPLMHFTYTHFTLSSSKLDGTEVACRKGCSHCCNIWTDAYAPEIFHVAAKAIATNRSDLNARIDETGKFSRHVSMSGRDRLPIPCPLLENRSCSQYASRPLNCRTAVSLSEAACEQAFIRGEDVSIPVNPLWGNLGQIYSMALKGALLHAGLACLSYELNEGLSVALSDPSSEARWLAGADIFKDCQNAGGSPPFSHPYWRSLYDHAFGT